MKPRPFYRWKSFWLGLFVLVFLGWALWRWSYQQTWFEYRYGGKSECFKVKVGEGMVGFGLQQDPFSETGFWESSSETGTWLPKRAVQIHDLGFMEVAIWFLILLFLVPWSAWLFWHWKREQKKSS